MPIYAFRRIDEAADVKSLEEHTCATEADALELAAEMATSHDVEIWRGDERITVITAKKKPGRR